MPNYYYWGLTIFNFYKFFLRKITVFLNLRVKYEVTFTLRYYTLNMSRQRARAKRDET